MAENERLSASGRGIAVPTRARRAALAVAGALVVVLIVHLAIGLADALLFGLVGGLVGSLVVIGLDLLRGAQGRVGDVRTEARGTGSNGEEDR